VTIERFSCSAIVAAVAICFGAGAVLAQSAPRDVLLGVSKVGQPATAPAGLDQDAHRLYEIASVSLRAGDLTSGQRQLEQLVARHPDSDSAERARRDLAAIYTTPKSPAALPAPPSYLGRPQATPQPASGASIATAQPAISAWRTAVRPPTGFQASAQEELRSGAGDLVFFSEGSAELGARARKALAAQAAWLNRNPDRSVTIEGHADETGTAADLLALSNARAEAVRVRLIEEGVAAARIRAVGHAGDHRVAICGDESCASQNRRAVTRIGAAVDARLLPR
jgi:outer membrane protein OmpA-like peptidoglycan-associated protein